MENIIIIALAFLGLFLLQLFFLVTRYKRSQPGKTLIVTGKVSPDPNIKLKILKTSAAFVWPVIQDSFYLSHSQIQFELETQSIPEKITYKSEIVFRISDNEKQIEVAAKNFPKMDSNEIISVVKPSLIQGVNSILQSTEKGYHNKSILLEIEKELDSRLKIMGCELVMNKVIMFE